MKPPEEKRWQITIVDRTQYYRRPRTKKRRILKKWRKDKRNYRPLMVPVGHTFLFGKNALLRARGKSEPDPYHNHEDPSRPRKMEMHSDLWAMTQKDVPEFARLCDVVKPTDYNFLTKS